MKKIIVLALCLISSLAHAASSTEDFKGPIAEENNDFSFMLGMGTLDSTAGFSLLGSAATRIAKDGWVKDVNNSVFAEIQAGPLFISSETVFAYSLHFRWDFQKDESWKLYALGGFAGAITPTSLGNRFILLPRFGVGAGYQLDEQLGLRGEFSRELIGVGVSYRI